MKQVGQPISRRTVSAQDYVGLMKERIHEEPKRGRGFIDTRDLLPPEIVPGIHASLEGIIAQNRSMTNLYPFIDPSSRFLLEALTRNGYVADPSRHFSKGTTQYSTFDRGRFNTFVEGFNLHMKDLYRVVPHTEVHPNGHVLTRASEASASDPWARVVVEPERIQALHELRSLAEEYRALRRS